MFIPAVFIYSAFLVGNFLFAIFVNPCKLEATQRKYCKYCCGKKKLCQIIVVAFMILGVQLLLFHAPFIGLGLLSLPFQATITIGMYVSVIIVIVIGISLARYQYHLSKKCSCSQFFIIVATFLTAAMIMIFSEQTYSLLIISIQPQTFHRPHHRKSSIHYCHLPFLQLSRLLCGRVNCHYATL